MKFKRIASLALLITCIGSISAVSYADSSSQFDNNDSINIEYAIGGWDEFEGDFFNGLGKSSSPDSHKGEKLHNVDSSGNPYYRSRGTTQWNVRHTTTAELYSNGSRVRTKQSTGLGTTRATTDAYYPKVIDNTHAKTFWKKA